MVNCSILSDALVFICQIPTFGETCEKLELNVGVRFQHWFPPRGFGMSSVYTAAWPSILLQSEINYEIDIAGMRGMNSSCSGGVVGSGELLDSSQVAVSRCRLTEERISQYAVVELQRTLHHCCCCCGGYYRCCRPVLQGCRRYLSHAARHSSSSQAGRQRRGLLAIFDFSYSSLWEEGWEWEGRKSCSVLYHGWMRVCVRGVGGAPLQHTARTPYSSSWLHHRLLLLLLLPGSSSHSLEWP